jgi:hypothetical protein
VSSVTDASPGRDAGIVATVREYGWSALCVPGTYDFAYTVGLWHSFRLPELVMFGLHGDGMQQWLNACVARVREAGWPAAEESFPGVIEGFETMLRPVDESWRDVFFGTAHRFYRGRPVPVWQLVWPDATGRWPWDEQATASCRTRQARAWLPVDRHPAGSWRLLGEFSDGFPLPAEADTWALTTRSILDGTLRPTRVVFDDDVFDVLDDRGYEAGDLCLTYLGSLVQRHPALRGLSELTAGSVASAAPDGTWARSAVSEAQRAASAAGWERGRQETVPDR